MKIFTLGYPKFIRESDIMETVMLMPRRLIAILESLGE